VFNGSINDDFRQLRFSGNDHLVYIMMMTAPLHLTVAKNSKHGFVANALIGLQFYSPDSHAPWQPGTNGNTNGLLREYLLKFLYRIFF